MEKQVKKITLPSGKEAEIAAFKGKHVREAQRRVSDSNQAGDAGAMTFILISMLTTIDGKQIVVEELDEMDGQDALALMGEFSAANFR